MPTAGVCWRWIWAEGNSPAAPMEVRLNGCGHSLGSVVDGRPADAVMGSVGGGWLGRAVEIS